MPRHFSPNGWLDRFELDAAFRRLDIFVTPQEPNLVASQTLKCWMAVAPFAVLILVNRILNSYVLNLNHVDNMFTSLVHGSPVFTSHYWILKTCIKTYRACQQDVDRLMSMPLALDELRSILREAPPGFGSRSHHDGGTLKGGLVLKITITQRCTYQDDSFFALASWLKTTTEPSKTRRWCKVTVSCVYSHQLCLQFPESNHIMKPHLITTVNG